MNILSTVIHIIGSDVFANIVSLIGVLLVVLGMISGLIEFVKRHEEQRYDASFGYYTNLDCFLERIKALILDEDDKSIGVLALFSSDSDYRTKRAASTSERSGQLLGEVATELLKYISTSSNLIPPCDTIEEATNWNEKLKELITHLNSFVRLNNDFRNPDVYDEETEEKYCASIVLLITGIQTILKREIENTLHKVVTNGKKKNLLLSLFRR